MVERMQLINGHCQDFFVRTSLVLHEKSAYRTATHHSTRNQSNGRDNQHVAWITIK